MAVSGTATGVDAITGPASVCTGTTINLADATPGGTWSSSNNSIATISSAGVVTGVAAGTVTISYALPRGTNVASTSVTVNAPPGHSRH